MGKKNHVPGGFLAAWRWGKKREVRYLPVARGFPKLEYGLYSEEDALSRVSYVLRAGAQAPAVGRSLELVLHRDRRNERVTFIAENGISGVQWTDGSVFWGHTLDEDTGPFDTRAVGLDEWVDECVRGMINPSPEELAALENDGWFRPGGFGR